MSIIISNARTKGKEISRSSLLPYLHRRAVSVTSNVTNASVDYSSFINAPHEYFDDTTISEILRRAGLTTKKTRRRVVRFASPLIEVTRPNQVWCMDFKGSFECGNGERCDTFTVTDAYSRFVLYCQAIANVNHEEVDKISDALMAQYGVPERIRTDNGTNP